MPGADHGLPIAEHGEIPFPVEGKFELLADRFLVENEFNTGQRPGKRHHGRNITGLAQMYTDE